MLLDLFQEGWMQHFRSKFLLLPGGFISVDWPRGWGGCYGWSSTVADVGPLVEKAVEVVTDVMSDRLVAHMAGRIGAVAMGIDFARDKTTDAYAELIAVYDVNTRAITFTGKSLPRSDQRTLVRVADLSTHFINIEGERLLALGCHDLNMFSPRGRGVQKPNGRLQELRRDMDERVLKFQPTVVLQLPHGTDTPNTWRAAWRALTASCKSIRSWASGISYFRTDAAPTRRPLVDVLAGTRGGACVDFVVEPPYRSPSRYLTTPEAPLLLPSIAKTEHDRGPIHRRTGRQS